MSEYTLALIGFGGVNRALAQLALENNSRWKSELGFELKVVGVCDLFLGSVVNPKGVDLTKLCALPSKKGSLGCFPGGRTEACAEDVIRLSGANIAVEATFTNLVDGQPARDYCRLALSLGMHVVTTNKGPVAFEAVGLKKEAAKHGSFFEFEGSVMSGTPIIALAKDSLAGAEIIGFEGILNGTSNFVLSCMEAEGTDFDSAIKNAQESGYAEADPTADVDGYDVRLKVVILANELLGADLVPSNVRCKGIRDLSLSQLTSAVDNGSRWKLIGSAEKTCAGTVQAIVEPKLVPLNNPLAVVSGAANAVTFKTRLLGDVTVRGPGAGRIETAYALLSDIIRIHKTKLGGKQ